MPCRARSAPPASTRVSMSSAAVRTMRQRDRAVGEVQAVADGNVCREPGVADAHRCGAAFDIARRQRERIAGAQADDVEPRRERAGAHLRSRQILEHCDVASQIGRDGAHVGERAPVFRVRAVREVQPHDVGAGFDEVAQYGPVARRWSERRDDLRTLSRSF